VLTQVPLIKREFIKNNNIQLFNENLKAAQEWEFFSRLFYVTNHNDVDIIDKETVYIRKHQNSITRNSNFNREFEYYKARAYIKEFLLYRGDKRYQKFFNDY